MREICVHLYDDIISVENLLEAWSEFRIGKGKRRDVLEYELQLMENLFDLHYELKENRYKHGSYEAFSINDPKPRRIHKATVKDRIVHRAVSRKLYPLFDKKFIHDSYSCRLNKGTHKALARFQKYARVVSKNNTQACWVLKCDIQKFFDSVDHTILKKVLYKHIKCDHTLLLLEEIIESFQGAHNGKGLPLGNLTSQLLVNVYMNEFDQFVKRVLKRKYYIRYADDFVFLSVDTNELDEVCKEVQKFLNIFLQLKLHAHKVSIQNYAKGVDFLGWVHFPYNRVLRRSTKRRLLKNVNNPECSSDTLRSYSGLLQWGNCYKISNILEY